MEKHLERLEKARQQSQKAHKSKGGKSRKDEKKVRPRDNLFDGHGNRKSPNNEMLEFKPMFILAHELYDALPIH